MTWLIGSNEGAVAAVVSMILAVRTLAVPSLVVTVTTPRWVPPSCVKLRMWSECSSLTVSVSGELVMITL
jgi:hypothetical protein